jgi:hypothetical protein
LKSFFHISVSLEYPVREIKVPYGQEESSFLKVLGETFPQIYPNVEAFKTSRWAAEEKVPRGKHVCCHTKAPSS